MAGEELKPCPLCRSPHTSLARNIHGEVERVFCKVCDCSAPIAAWNRCPSPSLAGEYERGFLACREAAVKVATSMASDEDVLAQHCRNANTGQREECQARSSAHRYVAAAIASLTPQETK